MLLQGGRSGCEAHVIIITWVQTLTSGGPMQAEPAPCGGTPEPSRGGGAPRLRLVVRRLHHALRLVVSFAQYGPSA